MPLELPASHRRKFAEHLRRHRDRHSVTDLEYSDNILKVSINTYKKCLEANAKAPLALQRATFVKLFENAQLEPSDYGMNFNLPLHNQAHGGYTQDDYGFIAGRYLTHRRSFLTGANITRSVLDITWNVDGAFLAFHEHLHYIADNGAEQHGSYKGEIFMHKDRVLMSLLTIRDGEVRVTMVHVPEKRPLKHVNNPVKMLGALVTHGYPKHFFQPVVSPVLIEEAPSAATASPVDKLCGTISPDDREFARVAKELQHAEDHAVVMTSLLARKAG